ncbi:CinA family nicotinamide mononucleotide deamidase-related protein [bacterium AH-315-K03]|nr:CinA family nicotinamide mononucleotide deamidase-related protein [bacterium AH-315-K03]
MNIQVLLTGNELMSGHTVDSNSATIAMKLAAGGFKLSRKVTLGDDYSLLVSELAHLSSNCDVLIVNGGLGPTIDDLTAQALSETSGQALEENATALAHLTDWCDQRKYPLNKANLKQTILPSGAQVIPNPVGSAVGFHLDFQDCLIICTPGVPSELTMMLDQSIVALISQRFPEHKPGSTIRFQTFGVGESNLQQLINNQYSDWPQEVELGFRAGMPLLEIKLTIADKQHKDIQQQCYQRVRQMIGDYIVGEESTTLAEAVVHLLQTKKQTISTAESCTGGQIAAAITQVPGASSVFEAGFVTYSNAMKQQLLGVDDQILTQYGAVSEQTVKCMALGAMEQTHADYAIAVSGIAGPDGGTKDKPVGTVWLAWGSKNTIKTREMHFNLGRQVFQSWATAMALDLLRRELLSIEAAPRYFKSLRR